MSLHCGYPGCKKKFKVDCPTMEIYQHLAKVHNIDISNTYDLIAKAACLSLLKSVFQLDANPC